MDKLQTIYWNVDNFTDMLTGYPQIQAAALLIKEGKTVAFPTETVYGLGANALSGEAVSKIFEAKGRPSDNPLIIHISNRDMLMNVIEDIPENAAKLMDAYWPGPITLVLPKKKDVPDNVTGGLSTVAIRMPNHPVALSLIETAGLPIAAPSANLSGKPSPTTAAHVYEDLNGRISGIIDGGATGIGVESTVVDCTGDIPVILRPGGITKEQMEEVVDNVWIDKALLKEGQAPKSPGMKYKHYSPDAPLVLVEGEPAFLQQFVQADRLQGKRVGVLTTAENVDNYAADVILPCGQRSDLHTVLKEMYHVLRTFNQYDVDIIYSEMFPREGVGEALMNRLWKAANGNVISKKTN